MSAWLHGKRPRSTGVGVLVSVVIHAFFLFGLIARTLDSPSPVSRPSASARPAIEVRLITESIAVGQALTTPGAPTESSRSSARNLRPTMRLRDAPAPQSPATAAEEVRAPIRVSDDVGQAAMAPTHETHTNPTLIDTADNIPAPPAIRAASPDYAYNPQPDYPMLLRDQGIGGVVWLRVWVGTDGRPADIKLAKGSGYRLLDDSALRAVKQWRFVPAKKGTQALASWVEFPIRFTLDTV